jgi:hypothetical protein
VIIGCHFLPGAQVGDNCMSLQIPIPLYERLRFHPENLFHSVCGLGA